MSEVPPASIAEQGVGAPRKLALARLLLGCSGPMAVGAALGLGWLVVHSFNWALNGREMMAAGIISVAAGLGAVLPLLLFMERGAMAIVRLTMVATFLRMGLMVGGLILALGPGWKLSVAPLVGWALGCYLVMLAAESAATAWVVRHG